MDLEERILGKHFTEFVADHEGAWTIIGHLTMVAPADLVTFQLLEDGGSDMEFAARNTNPRVMGKTYHVFSMQYSEQEGFSTYSITEDDEMARLKGVDGLFLTRLMGRLNILESVGLMIPLSQG